MTHCSYELKEIPQKNFPKKGFKLHWKYYLDEHNILIVQDKEKMDWIFPDHNGNVDICIEKNGNVENFKINIWELVKLVKKI